MEIQVRWWIELDTPEVLDIERLNYGEDAYDEAHYNALLAQRTHVGLVAIVKNKVVGHCIYELREGNNFILILQTHPQYHNMGVATAIVDKMKAQLAKHKTRRFLVTEVMESNLNALYFFKKNGFVAFKVVKNDYFDSDDDGIMMKWDKVKVESGQNELIEL